LNRAATALVLAALTLTTACGGNDDTEQPAAQATPTAKATESTTPDPSPTPTETTGPEYALLSEDDLEAALLTIQDMPVGYSQDPESESSTTTKTFCDYKPPFTEKTSVSRDFTKGGGMSTEFLAIGLRQYQNADQARAAFNALTKALDSCKSETFEGTTLEYALMSAPKVGDDTVGIRISADSTTILQNFALVGPTLVNTGGGGLMQANADEIANLLEAQVKAYQTAATK
jgi:hypothetical protein